MPDALSYIAASRKRRAAVRAATIAVVNRAAIFERDGGICGICGEPVDPDRWHLDHVVAIARGGAHEPSNVQVAHPRCNLTKGTAP